MTFTASLLKWVYNRIVKFNQELYAPVRGFFVGNNPYMNKTFKVLLVALLLSYPATIRADTFAAANAVNTNTASSGASTPASLAAAPAINVAATKTVWVTAYTSDPDETSDHPLITASGGMVHDGVVAANFLPFGTEIEIPSLFGSKVFTVEDRTSEKFSGRVDIWMPTYNRAIDFGIQHAEIVIVDGNGTDIALQ